MPSTNVTLRTLSLGTQDSTTGWYSKSFSTSTIQMPIFPKGATFHIEGIGYLAHYPHTGYTNSAVNEGDEILDAASRYFQIHTIQPWYQADSLEFFECDLDYDGMHADRPSTSGTWTLEGGSSLNLDPRFRHKTLLDDVTQGLVSTNLKEDNNSTNATYITVLGGADYPISKVFITKGVDLIFCVESARTQMERLYDRSIAHNIHDVVISLWAMDKSTITATRLIRAAQHELERIFETYPTGSVRNVGAENPEERIVGSTPIWTKKTECHYKIGISG